VPDPWLPTRTADTLAARHQASLAAEHMHVCSPNVIPKTLVKQPIQMSASSAGLLTSDRPMNAFVSSCCVAKPMIIPPAPPAAAAPAGFCGLKYTWWCCCMQAVDPPGVCCCHILAAVLPMR
jgi:hypothetical protein